MIVLFSNQPVTLQLKSELLALRAKSVLGSDFNDTSDTPWFGDKLTIESLFPQWILKEYDNNPSNVLVTSLVKNYLRWLFSLEYGYGAQLDWENIRIPIFMNSVFLEALADFYFPSADFSIEPLASKLKNIRTFATKVDANYFNIKGTSKAIKYVICGLLGFDWDDIYVNTSSYVTVEIKIASSQVSSFEPFKPFLEKHVIPAGMVVHYSTI